MSSSQEEEAKMILEAQQKLYKQLKDIPNPNPTALFHILLLERQFEEDPVQEEKIVEKVCKHLFDYSELHTKENVENTLEMIQVYQSFKGDQTDNINLKKWVKRLRNIRKGLGR